MPRESAHNSVSARGTNSRTAACYVCERARPESARQSYPALWRKLFIIVVARWASPVAGYSALRSAAVHRAHAVAHLGCKGSKLGGVNSAIMVCIGVSQHGSQLRWEFVGSEHAIAIAIILLHESRSFLLLRARACCGTLRRIRACSGGVGIVVAGLFVRHVSFGILVHFVQCSHGLSI